MSGHADAGSQGALTASSALALGLAMAAVPATATQPIRDVQQGTGINCELLPVGEGDTSLFLGAFFSWGGDVVDGFGEVVTPAMAAWAYQGTGELDAGEYVVTYEFADEEGAVVGSLTLEGSTAPAGEPFTIDERSRDGNSWSMTEGTVQELLVSGEITAATGDLTQFDGLTLGCQGADVDLEFWGTNPATRIYRGTGANAYCQIGEDGFLGVDIFDEGVYGILALGIDWETGTADLVAQGELQMTPPSITGDLEVFEPPPTDPENPDVATVNLTIGAQTDSGSIRFKDRQDAHRERYTLYALSGEVDVPGYGTIPLDNCEYRVYSFMERYSSQAGQKPGGKPPVNDLPGNALAIADDATARVSTRGAAEEPEVACMVEGPGEPEGPEGPVELPFGRTVWYKFVGTGGEVTLSTAGSDFDTAIGVYRADGLAQVACVDDTPETGLQAAVTVPTDVGVGYLVQVGGFGWDWGRVVLGRS